jgi:UDP-N-acetylmuramyl pentapeptide phosphotransferase/UDP-N-acetylglucosamine-1-phosphate transferase
MIYLFFLSLIFLNELIIKYNLLPDKVEISKHKIYVNDKKIPTSAGFFLIFFIIIFKNDISYLNLFYIFSIFFIGLLSDKIKNFSPIIRLFLQIIFTFLFIQGTETYIQDVRIYEINIFLEQNIFITSIFTIFCFIVLLNGTNFIDGTNLNTIGYYIIVYLLILIISRNNNFNLDFNFHNKILIFLGVIYLLNILHKTQLGDAGAYLISFFTAFYVIKFVNLNPSISPYFAILLLWYPCFENLFSIFRKILNKKKISEADNLHLHHNIFTILKNNKFNNANNITGLILNLSNLSLMILGLIYFDSTKVLLFLITFNIFCYLISYYFLIKKIT